jgi:glycosyltransferase involved in cell wall biosynthesis
MSVAMLLCLIPEPPFDPRSWSGIAAPFFGALRDRRILSSAHEVKLSPLHRISEQMRVFDRPLARWKENYHASVHNMRALGRVASGIMHAQKGRYSAVLQIGAWFCAAANNDWSPVFSYHDGNAAMWYRHYGRGLLSNERREEHLAYERFTYKGTTGIFVMSQWLADSFVNDFDVPSEKLHVVGAGANINGPYRPIERKLLKTKFLIVGKDFERKGGKYLLEAFRRVHREVPSTELVIVGPSLELKEPGVRCEGFLSKNNFHDQKRLAQIFEECHCIVLPSIYEPFGISLVEGMIHNMAAIAADRCAMPEIVKHRETGLVVPPENADALAEAMIELATHPKQTEAYGMAGMRRANDHFTWQAVAQKMHTVLRDRYNLFQDAAA